MGSLVQGLLAAANTTVTTTTQSTASRAFLDCKIYSNNTFQGNCPYYFDKVIGPLNLWLYGVVGLASITMAVLIIYVWRLGYWRQFWGWSGLMVLGRFHDGSAVLMKAIRYGNFIFTWHKLATGYIYSARNTAANVIGGPTIFDADLRAGIAGTPKAAAYANAISGKADRGMLRRLPGKDNPLLDPKNPVHIKTITEALLKYWEDKMNAIPDYRSYVRPEDMKEDTVVSLIANDGSIRQAFWKDLTAAQQAEYKTQYTALSKSGRELSDYKSAQMARIQEVRTRIPGKVERPDATGQQMELVPLDPLQDADIMDFLYQIAEALKAEPIGVWPAEIIGVTWDARDLADWFLSTYHPSDQVKFEGEVVNRERGRNNRNDRVLTYLGLIIVMSCVGIAILYIVIHG